MLFIIILGLIARLALVCDGCDIGSWGVDNFDWKKVGTGDLIQFLTNKLTKLLSDFICHLWFH
jgi:hypothetical protein